MLKRIKSSDLIFSGEIEDDRTNTYLHLLDYDWMNYMLQTRFKTKEQGLLDVSFEYCGMTKSQMRVKQTYKGNTEEYVIDFPTDVFVGALCGFTIGYGVWRAFVTCKRNNKL